MGKKPTERSTAMGAGLVRYFTGKPCKFGHIAERNTSDGRCCECSRLKALAQYAAAPELARVKAARWRETSPQVVSETLRRYRLKNRDKVLESKRAYWRDNPGKRVAADAKRRSKKVMATPPWFGEFDDLVWSEAGDLIRIREAATGIKWHADHAIPLASKTACGLHVAQNCQVIPAALNLAKNNRTAFTAPGSWIMGA
jgi:hypothetical protein